jgi:hypothetical protein
VRARIKNRTGEVLFETELKSFPATIGRDPACALPVANVNVSGRHAEIDWNGSRLTFRDLGSTNGSFFENNRVSVKSCGLPCSFLLGGEIFIELGEEAAEYNLEPTQDRIERAMVARPPLPVVIKVRHSQVAERPEITIGFRDYAYGWQFLQNTSLRDYLVVSGFISLLYGLSRLADGIMISLVAMIGSFFLAPFLSIIIALVLAVPGRLFRGAYDLKPLFYQQSIGILISFLCLEGLQPLVFFPVFGLFATMLIVPLLVLVYFGGTYIFLFNSFPHRWGKALLGLSVFLALAFCKDEIKNVVLPDKQEAYREALFKDKKQARRLAGATVPVSTLADEIRGLEKAR